jgi:hypothetical protein
MVASRIAALQRPGRTMVETGIMAPLANAARCREELNFALRYHDYSGLRIRRCGVAVGPGIAPAVA